MKFAGITVLALGASAYVVSDAPKGDVVEARNPVGIILLFHPCPFNEANTNQGSGPVLASYNINVVARHRAYNLLSIKGVSLTVHR
jgi:hypothetical protein